MRHSSRQPPEIRGRVSIEQPFTGCACTGTRNLNARPLSLSLSLSLSLAFFFLFFSTGQTGTRLFYARRFVVSEESDICIRGRRRVKRIVRTGDGVSFTRAYVRTGIQLSVHEFHYSRQVLTIARGYSTKNERYADQPFAHGNFNFIV